MTLAWDGIYGLASAICSSLKNYSQDSTESAAMSLWPFFNFLEEESNEMEDQEKFSVSQIKEYISLLKILHAAIKAVCIL